jgi:hypothetical protein
MAPLRGSLQFNRRRYGPRFLRRPRHPPRKILKTRLQKLAAQLARVASSGFSAGGMFSAAGSEYAELPTGLGARPFTWPRRSTAEAMPPRKSLRKEERLSQSPTDFCAFCVRKVFWKKRKTPATKKRSQHRVRSANAELKIPCQTARGKTFAAC